jgi:uncharacterized membrane-anchored protein
VASLVPQFRASRYRTPIYWFTLVKVAVLATMAADIPRDLGIPLWASATAYLLAAVTVFALWWRTEGTVSFADITTQRSQAFYWAAVLATFALGTAVGDLTAITWGLGTLASGVLFATLLCLPALAHYCLGLNATAAFWITYALTRPLGTSFTDWMGLSPARGGLGLGMPLTAGMWALAIATVVGYLTVSKSVNCLQTGARRLHK